MKILKLNSILLSLVAIAIATVFLNSCTKDDIKLANQETFENTGQNEGNYDYVNLFINNVDFSGKTESEITEYFKNLSSVEILNLKNDYLIAEYLIDRDLFHKILLENQTVFLSEIDLSNYVDEFELNKLNTQISTGELGLREDCLYKKITISYICDPSCFLKYTPFPCNPICKKTIWVKCN